MKEAMDAGMRWSVIDNRGCVDGGLYIHPRPLEQIGLMNLYSEMDYSQTTVSKRVPFT